MSNSQTHAMVNPVLEVPESDLQDLLDRLRRTRWPRPWPLEPWRAGVDPAVLRELVDHWADGFDWREQEAVINALPHHQVEVEGVRVHHLRFEGEGGLPLLLANGWPSTFFEMVGLARRLAQAGHTIIVPSLPGFTFSDPRPTLDRSLPTHELWHRLMKEELGFERYGVHGGDLGAGHAGRLAQAHPESVVALHLTDADRTLRDTDADLSDEERDYLAAEQDWSLTEGAYAHQQGTKPLTLAQGLGDSPSGLLAWVVEKYRAWSDSDGDVLTRFPADFLLTQASLYWFTNTISTSFRDYYERRNGFATALVRVEVPTALTWFPADLGARPPRRWLERRYHLTRHTVMPRGGHFAPVEEPDLLAEAITSFFAGVGD